MFRLLAVIILFAVAGCGLTPRGDAFRADLKEKGKDTAAAGLENAEWYLCRVASVGAIKDRYGISMEKVYAYNMICRTDSKFTPIVPTPALEATPL